MTQENSSDTTQAPESGESTLFNTAAGWVLFAAGLGLGLSILSGKYFHAADPESPETPGYFIEVAEAEGSGEAEMTMAAALNMMPQDELVAKGERVFAKCQACHNVAQGGANGVGPNLHAIMGAPFAAKAGFNYSSALSGTQGQWGWEEMNQWLANPKGYVSGTSMSFAGLGKIEDRAAVALYLNANGSNLAVPEYVEAAASESDGEGELTDGEETEAEGADETATTEEVATAE